MIDAIKSFFVDEKQTMIDIAVTAKTQVIETAASSKLPIVVVGGTVATTYTASEVAQWAAAFMSLVYAGKLLVDVWARITEITMKKRSQRIEMKRQERELDSNN